MFLRSVTGSPGVFVKDSVCGIENPVGTSTVIPTGAPLHVMRYVEYLPATGVIVALKFVKLEGAPVGEV